MNNEELAALNDATDRLLEETRPFLDPRALSSIETYMSGGEIGLAIEVILYCIERENTSLPAAQKDALYSLAKRMNLNLDKLRENWPKK